MPAGSMNVYFIRQSISASVLVAGLIFSDSAFLSADEVAVNDIADLLVEGEPLENFYQDVDVQRQPKLKMQGIPIDQNIHYQVRSFFSIYKPDESGRRMVVQEIRDSRLVDADLLSRPIFSQSLAKLSGKKMTYRVDQSGKVLAFAGYQSTKKNVAINQANLTGAMITDVIDEDGWKELAALTLFRPGKAISRKDTFDRRTSHEWGSLGSWYGTTTFELESVGRNAQGFSFTHKLEYIKPLPDKKASPMKIHDATFKTIQSNGMIEYDPKVSRVKRVREWFHVQGTVDTEVLGSKMAVALEEKQMMTITVRTDTFKPRGRQ